MKPAPRALAHLRPRDGAGALALSAALASTGAGLALAILGGWIAWIAGQALLAIAFLQWFALLHESGHRTLFASRGANRLSGHLASVFAVIPFHSWSRIHARHACCVHASTEVMLTSKIFRTAPRSASIVGPK